MFLQALMTGSLICLFQQARGSLLRFLQWRLLIWATRQGRLKADMCYIYTDVDGVYTSDPNIVPNARKLNKISYEEMLEMASLGAKVLHSRSVEFAAKYNVPLRVLSSFTNNSGTLVTKEDKDMEQEAVSGVTYDKNASKISLIGVPDKPGIAGRKFC